VKLPATSLLAIVAATSWAPALHAQVADQPPARAPADPAPTVDAQAEAAAQQPVDPEIPVEDEEVYEEDIVVVGRPERGRVIGDIPPEVTLDARDIRAYGTGSIAELLDELSPQTQSGRGRGGGRPVTLLNGRRISSFSEIRSLPPEALERVEILPEEVALKYGYRADQRVVNFVLRERFRAVTAEVEAGLPTAGGRSQYEAEANWLRLRGDTRLSIDAEYEHQTPLFETERDIIDPEPFRTLLGESDAASIGATYSRPVGTVSATINGRYERNGSEGQLGLSEAGEGPLLRESDSWTGHLGVALSGQIAPWNWSFTGNYDHAESDTSTDRSMGLGPVFQDRAKSNTETGDAEFVANGSLFRLPAGEVSTTLKAGVETRHLSSEALRSGAVQERDLSRTQGNLQANIDLPIASRREDVLAGIGNLSANFHAALNELSDFGTLTTWGAGINWSPVEQVRVIASYTNEDGAPTIQQLGDPTLVTPNVRVFDFVQGETVDVTQISGGNRDLLADNRRVWKLGINVKPLEEADLTFTADFIDSRTRNLISSFPTATPEIEAAFPERFTRDASGRLISIDTRPVNFARADRQELRWGINFSEPLEPTAAERAAAESRRAEFRARREAARAAGQTPAEGGTPPRAGGEGPGAGPGSGRGPGGGFGGRGGFGRGGGGPEGRLQLSLYHTWRFKDEVEIREGVPVLDLLEGSATGRGGQSRHQIEARAGVSKNGLGARLNVNWQSATQVLADPNSDTPSGEDLFFDDFTTMGLRFFADLGQQRSLVREWGFLRGARVTLAIDNLFDARQGVRTRAGDTPITYQPDLIDPLGRTVRLSFRKLFF
jgi:iron complex outermembrane receptor protein